MTQIEAFLKRSDMTITCYAGATNIVVAEMPNEGYSYNSRKIRRIRRGVNELVGEHTLQITDDVVRLTCVNATKPSLFGVKNED